MTRLLGPALLATALLAAPASRADHAVPCADAAAEGQQLRNAHDLVRARGAFLRCASRQCPAVVQHDCVDWLGEVDRSLPTVVVTARDGAGTDLVDVRVSVDGQGLLTKLDGQAVPVNPGRHVFQLALADGTQIDQGAVIKEGVKDQIVSVTLGQPVRPAAPAPVDADPADAPPARSSRAVVVLGWGLGGAGILGLGVGAVLGALAVVDNGDARCNASRQCLPGPLRDARTAAAGADVGLVAGGALLAAGVTLVLVAPPREGSAPTALRLAPTAGERGAGLALGGVF